MKPLDWIVLIFTLLVIILYGIYKSRTSRNLDGYFLSNRDMPWYIILLSIMGTQASAITFISAPGQAYTDGMRFVQYYFGLPLAAIVICISFVPVFHKLKVYTAYEFLETRFNVKTRALTSFLFLLQRGLSTGISIFAPSIILSILLDWNIYLTNLFMGGLLIIYTVTGGAKSVAYTQQLQFVIIMSAMLLAGYFVVKNLPQNIGLKEAITVGGKLGKFNVITTGIENGKFNWGDKYNIFSGILGSFFLMLSYFGTDQSQVGRYLTAKTIRESRLGLLLNGIVKIPMQFFILLLGVLVLAFYQFNNAPAFFNQHETARLENSAYKNEFHSLQKQLSDIDAQKQTILKEYAQTKSVALLTEVNQLQKSTESIRSSVKELVKKNGGKDNDTNYIFLKFVVDYLPTGLVGLIIAVIFLASWGSIAAALNSLASSTIVDFHKRFFKKIEGDEDDYRFSKLYTFLWGIFCIGVAMFVSQWGNSLIEVVNILGSLFYGTILGIFLVAFYAKKVRGNTVFIAAVIAEIVVIALFFLNEYKIISLGFLWLNAVGALLVYFLSESLNVFAKKYKVIDY
ncbi:MAG: sodium:solute symporter [Sphingobacteriales bacterium]|jgi:SSS family solute:Na+ symporter|nr:sodium:solute symporter [Sphingobacteriales bacterium]